MKDTQKHPKMEFTGHMGVNRDVAPEKLDTESGLIFDSRNTRRNSSGGNMGAREKIGGEVLKYPNIDNRCIGGTGLPLTGNYRAIRTDSVNGDHVEIWADQDGIAPVVIRVNGKIVCMTSEIPYIGTIDLQGDVDENTVGGEIFVTDNVHVPMLFNIRDLKANSGMIPGSLCTQKYFTDFKIEEHTVSLSQRPSRMAFIKLSQDTSESDFNFIPEDPVGLPVGYYTYSLRYSTESGEKTGWSPATPQIPVVRNDSAGSAAYLRSRTRGDSANLSAPTSYGIQLKYRVENTLNYKFIEVRRTEWNAEDPLNTPPVYKICGKFNISPGQNNVVTIGDFGGFEEDLGADDIGEVMAAIDTAKTLRYSNKRLWMSNIKYASRVLKDTEVEFDFFDDGSLVKPVQQWLGKDGLSSPYNHTYFKNYTSREKFGFAVVLFDGQSSYSYPLPISGAENFQFPGRRDEIAGDSLDMTYYDPVLGANNQGEVSPVFEAFSLHDASKKTVGDLWHNILNDGSKSVSLITSQVDGAFPFTVPGEFVGGGFGTHVQGENVGFRPFTPVSQVDPGVLSLDFRVNIFALDGSNVADRKSYNPKGFSPDYYSKGIALKGIKNKPQWAKGMAIAKTVPAKKVMAQGLAFYAMTSATGQFGVNTSKATNKIWLYCPDFHNSSGIDPELVQNIMNDYSSYAIEVQSPLGFFSEVYSFFDRQLPGTPNQCVDMISYARIIREEFESGQAQINPNDQPGWGIDSDGKNYTGFGVWRDGGPNTNGIFAGGQNPTYGSPIGISAINPTPQYRGRGYYVEVTLDQDIFWYATSGGTKGTDDSVRRWHEPVYIVNIVKKTADVPTQNIKNYFFTGQYLSFESMIGVSVGLQPQSFELVDERWEDCVNYLPGMITTGPYLSLERFVYVGDENGVKKKWVNVTYKSSPDIASILDDIASNGFAEITDSSGAHTVYGVYKHTISSVSPLNIKIDFIQFDGNYPTSFFIPNKGEKVFVLYDDRLPIKIFGGDSTVGETVFAPLDLEYGSDGNPHDAQNDFSLNVAFPVRQYELNPLQLITRKTQGLALIQDENKFQFDDILGLSPAKMRQLLVQFCAESRIVTNFAFNNESTLHSSNQFFPLKNYIMRPCTWDDGDNAIDNNMFQAYIDAYGDEKSLWNFGGFRFLQQTNIDYSKINNQDNNLISFPLVGFTEQNWFPDRTIWSLEREQNIQNSPSVRTFPELNYYDITDDTGQINLLHSMSSDGRGYNLYAFTDRGIYLMLVDKRTISELSGFELTTIASSVNGIVQDIPITKSIGIPDEMWRTKAEFNNVLRFENKKSRYLFDGAKAVDVFQGVYRSFLTNFITEHLSPGFTDHICSVYDQDHDEYWTHYRRSPRTMGLQGTVYELSMTDPLVSVVDAVQNPVIPVAFYDTPNAFPVSGSPCILFVNPQVPINDQAGIYLGGPTWSLLTSEVYIFVPASAPNALKVRFAQYQTTIPIIETFIINPGEAFRFYPAPAIYQVPFNALAYSFRHQPFLTGGDFTKDKCLTIVDAVVKGVGIIAEGRFSYAFDKFQNIENKVFGMRNLETYELNQGFEINGEPVSASIIGVPNPQRQFDKEFIWVKENSSVRPSEINFYEDPLEVDNLIPSTQIPGDWLFDRQGYENNIPRKYVDKNRMQKRHIFVEIVHKLAEEFVHIGTLIQYKILK